jgi:hypothetical protein
MDAKSLINGLVIRKLFAVVHRQSLHPLVQGLELGFNGPAHQISRLVGHLGQHSKASLAFYQCQDGLLLRGSDDGGTLLVAHLLTIFNVACYIADRKTIRYLPASFTSAQVTISLELLAAEVSV